MAGQKHTSSRVMIETSEDPHHTADRITHKLVAQDGVDHPGWSSSSVTLYSTLIPLPIYLHEK